MGYPFLAASPDGVVSDGSLIEVKCPFNGRNTKIKTGKLFPWLEERDGHLMLKKNHDYFFQVQGQLKIAQRKSCYFVTYTHCDVVIENIAFDEEFYDKMFLRLCNFYSDHYLPTVAKENAARFHH